MIITTTSINARIKYGEYTFTYPLNTLSYAINDGSEGITLFCNNESVGTSPIDRTTVNGEQLTIENMCDLLSPLFAPLKGDGNNTMIILTQSEYDALATKNENTLYFIKE